MTDTWREREARIIDVLSSRYRDRGYEVELEPRLEGSTLRADLVARRSDETVLVEVKRTVRDSDEVPQRLEAMAEYASQHGWRFSIVLVRDANSFDEVDVLGRDDVLRLLEDARALDASSWIAAIAATAAFEAAARFALARADHPSMPRPAPLAHVQALASRGLITPEEEAVLRQLVEARNAAAHGMTTGPAPDGVVSRALAIATALVVPEPAAA